MLDSFADIYLIFFFNDTATTEIYTLSLHDALPISLRPAARSRRRPRPVARRGGARPRARARIPPGPARHDTRHGGGARALDRKSTRLNSSHANISYAVFCLKKKNKAQLASRANKWL